MDLLVCQLVLYKVSSPRPIRPAAPAKVHFHESYISVASFPGARYGEKSSSPRTEHLGTRLVCWETELQQTDYGDYFLWSPVREKNAALSLGRLTVVSCPAGSSLVPRPPPQLLSLAVRKSWRRPGRVSHVMRAATVIKCHPFKTTMY